LIQEHLEVGRTARYWRDGAEPAEARELFLGLHGHAQLAERFLRDLLPLQDPVTLVAAPEALSRFYLETARTGRHGELIGATWLTREDRETDLADGYRYLDLLATHLVSCCPLRPRLTVLGFSQGSLMAARWLMHSTLAPARLILWGTPLPPEVEPEALASRLSGASVVLVAGDSDPVVPPGTIEANAAALQAAGLDARAERFAGGHFLLREPLLRAAGRAGTT
jgi:predicted esterase